MKRCRGRNSFEDKWSAEWVNAYNSLLGEADLVKYICPGYSKAAYQKRNEWMVDRASRVIAVYNGEPGGTRNTVEYAKKTGVSVWIDNALMR